MRVWEGRERELSIERERERVRVGARARERIYTKARQARIYNNGDYKQQTSRVKIFSWKTKTKKSHF